MSCKDCLHYEVCAYRVKGLFTCEKFKDKTKWAEQKHGRWIYNSQYTGKNKDMYICSECGNYYSLRKNRADFKGMNNDELMMKHVICCPRCGAKMDGDT